MRDRDVRRRPRACRQFNDALLTLLGGEGCSSFAPLVGCLLVRQVLVGAARGLNIKVVWITLLLEVQSILPIRLTDKSWLKVLLANLL